jgi:tetratricopeptide (TPR) repeat protein
MSRRFSELVLVALVAGLAGCATSGGDPRAGDVTAAPAAKRPADRGQEPAPAAILPADVDRKSMALFEQSLAAIAAQRWRDAEVLLHELTTRQPALSGPWVNLGIVQSELGRDADAEASFRKAVDVNPDNCAAYNELGLLRRRAGDFLAAEANYLACVQRVPDFREAHLNLGILYELYLGRLPEALDAYRAYLALIDGEDRRVAGWVSDIERRLAAEKDS